MKKAGKRFYVTDASVILKWFSQTGEKDLDKAIQLRKDFKERNIDLYAPELLIYEIANVLRYKKILGDDIIHKAISSIYDMDILWPVNSGVMSRALTIARLYHITVYDSSYLSFAQSVGCHLITADKKLYQKVMGLPGIIFISDYIPEKI
ncbi:MAG: type II toxin-antitoxin system VapC family toxin [Candidatus Aminicenantes bacterium]|nr:type II toxin-antitoxin system VapC family toxin [Candidatus Aminicenantes bacterium]